MSDNEINRRAQRIRQERQESEARLSREKNEKAEKEAAAKRGESEQIAALQQRIDGIYQFAHKFHRWARRHNVRAGLEWRGLSRAYILVNESVDWESHRYFKLEWTAVPMSTRVVIAVRKSSGALVVEVDGRKIRLNTNNLYELHDADGAMRDGVAAIVLDSGIPWEE